MNGKSALGGTETAGHHVSPTTVTVQLSSGAAVVIRRLRCGLLFVAIGPTTGGAGEQQQQQQTTQASMLSQEPAASSSPTLQQRSAPTGAHDGTGLMTQLQTTTTHTSLHPATASAGTPLMGSPSEASVLSATASVATNSSSSGNASAASGTVSAAAMATRRHAEELAKWLDEKLGGLCVPEEGIGVDA